jgi:Rrf2 family protein
MNSILKISEAASLGLHGMIILAQHRDEVVSVKYMAEQLDVSANHLSKVMQRLVKTGLVTSVKGNRGGFQLAQEPEKITLLDIYEAIDGKFNPSGCLLGRNACAAGECILGDLIRSVNKQVEDHFRGTKLNSFIKD